MGVMLARFGVGPFPLVPDHTVIVVPGDGNRRRKETR
jgi:hypothetical protein